MHVAGCQRSVYSLRAAPALTFKRETTATKCQRRSARAPVTAHIVDINVNGRTEVLEVAEDQTILEVALEQGIELSHDCKMGVCMTCPAKLVRLTAPPALHAYLPLLLCSYADALVSKTVYCSRSQGELIRRQAC